MFDSSGGYLWAVINIIGVIALGAALAYGASVWRKRPRDRTLEKVRDDATRNLYGDK